MHLKFFIFIVLFSFFSLISNAQDRIIEFQQLELLDSISDIHKIDSITEKDSLHIPGYLFISHFLDTDGFFLLKKDKFSWRVFSLELQLHNEITKIKIENNDFISVHICTQPPGGCLTRYCQIFFIKIKSGKYFQITDFQEEECFEEDGRSKGYAECSSSYSFKKDVFTVTSKKSSSKVFCSNSGKYKIGVNNLILIKP